MTANIHRSGDGSRPTTDGGVDNIGGAGTFTPGEGSSDAPKPPERMAEKKLDKASVKASDADPFNLHPSTADAPNVEPAPAKPGVNGQNHA
jgi:hypothetical protein